MSYTDSAPSDFNSAIRAEAARVATPLGAALQSVSASGQFYLPVLNVVAGGQSNEAGSDEAGSKVVEAGVYIWNGTAFIPAAFGTAPLNNGDSGLGYSNNAAVHFANNAIRSGRAGRVNILPNWHAGESLVQWVGAGTSSVYFAELTAMMAAAGITEIHAFLWGQGERDSTTETTGYHTRDLYAAGFETLKTQLRAQSWFPRTTPIIAQELGTWYDNNSQARNDYFQTIELGDDPYVAVVSAAGLTMGTGAGDAAHFSGDSLVKIGARRWATWLNMRLGMGQRVGFRTPEGFAVGRPRMISVSGATVNVPVDDLRNGAIIDAANATINLPQAGLVPGAEVTVNVWSVSVSSTTLASIQNISDVPWQADALSALLGIGTYVFKSVRSRWRYVSTTGSSYGFRQSGTITVSTTYAMTAAECADMSYIVAGSGTLVLPNPNGVTAQRGVVLRTSVAILLDVASGGLYAGGGVYMLAGAPILIPAEQVLVLRPTEPSRWSIVGGTWRPQRDQVIAQTSALTLTNTQSNNVYNNTGATARVDISLPAATAGLKYRFACTDVDGIRIIASTASADNIKNGATTSASGGYIESTTIGSFLEILCIDSTSWYVTSITGTWVVA